MYVMQPDLLKDVNGLTAIAVANQAVVFTKAHKVSMASVFGLAVSLASANGTPNVQIDMQVADFITSALEGVADSVGLNWCTQEGGATIITVADKVLHKITINPTPCVYVRFKLTGGASNQSDTVATIAVVNQQQLGR